MVSNNCFIPYNLDSLVFHKENLSVANFYYCFSFFLFMTPPPKFEDGTAPAYTWVHISKYAKTEGLTEYANAQTAHLFEKTLY